MKIDLTKIPSFWFGGIKPNRAKRITNMFKRTGIEARKLETFIDSDPVLGCALSMKNALKVINNIEGPCLVFEDDAETTAHVRTMRIEVPDDADAVYLCLSKYGVMKDWKTQHRDRMASEKDLSYSRLKNPNYVKLNNMVTLTAVIYITDRYKKHALREIDSVIPTRLHCDVPIALSLKDFNVYALTKPMFYQECPLSKKTTNFTI